MLFCLDSKYLLKIQMTVLHQKMVHASIVVSLLPYCTIAILRIERLENYMFCSKEKYEELSSSRTNISFSNPFLLLFLLYTKRLFIHVDVKYRVQTMIYTFLNFSPDLIGYQLQKPTVIIPFMMLNLIKKLLYSKQ